ncbi:hypothetical protein AWJ14_04055 [Hoeflea olei]|uniref:Caspase family p20 domain-containing protein n=1 Tax=Hoeflea olei TaxID=1480615 RepID=A0A1C1YWT8_9HYPH|nr:hypothetical protein AWJ14_04055 [Hoeflea olei]
MRLFRAGLLLPVLLVPLLLGCLPGLAVRAAAADRVALVIGNGAYRHAVELPNPRNDATDMAVLLRRLDFEVIEGVDLERAEMEATIRAFAAAATDARTVLFFYAGHGMQVDGRNYLIPVDARLEDRTALDFEAIDAERVYTYMAGEGKVAIAFLDACRDNPLARGFRRSLGTSRSNSVGVGLAPISTSGSGLFIAFATAPGDVAADGEGRNSPFTAALLSKLETPGLEIQQVMTRVKIDVQARTQGRQRPWHSSDLGTDVFLAPLPAKQTPVVPAPEPPQPDPSAASGPGSDPCRDAAAHWAAISGRKTAVLYEDHLKRFPTCSFASIARLELQEIRNSGGVPAPETAGRAGENQCDRLAAMPQDQQRLAGVKGVAFDKIGTAAAIAACEAAVRDFPDVPRFAFQLGRSLDAAKKFSEALGWYRKAAGAGHVAALNNIAFLYRYGDGVAQDTREALRLYEEAFEKGFAESGAAIASMYHNGEGVAADAAEYVRWHRKAADMGRRESMYALGMAYREGDGVDKDPEAAFEWLEKAADEGNGVPDAIYYVASSYDEGIGVSVNPRLAADWMLKAATAGDSHAMYTLGYFYYTGKGVKQDNTEAMGWYYRAAAAGSPDAMYMAAFGLDGGIGVARDRGAAAPWLVKALRASSEFTRDMLKTSPETFSLEARKALQQLLRQEGVYDGPIDGNFGRGTQAAIDKIYGKA